MFTVCIPILVYFFYRPKINLFFKILLSTFVLSAISEIVAYYSVKIYETNLVVYYINLIVNSLLITFMWYSIDTYSQKEKNFTILIGAIIFLLTLTISILTNIVTYTIYIFIIISVLLHLCLSLQYFYHVITKENYISSVLKDPYLIIAAAFIMHALSTSVIVSVRPFVDQQYVIDVLFVRQIFYFLYYCICSYVYFLLYKTQNQRWTHHSISY